MSVSAYRKFVWSLLYAVLFLFYFQLLADFVEAVYAFGLMSTSIPPQIVAVLLLLSPLGLLALRAEPRPWVLHLLFAVVVGARLAYPMLGTYERMLTTGLGLAAWGMLLPLLLERAAHADARDMAVALASGLMAAVATSALLRTVGSGLDASTLWWGAGLSWAAVAVGLWYAATTTPEVTAVTGRHHSVIMPVLGLTSVLILMYFVFTAPHVLARWSGLDYRWVAVFFALGMGGMALAFAWAKPPARRGSGLFYLNVVVVLALTSSAAAFQPIFPSAVDTYPLLELPPTVFRFQPLVALLLFFPLFFLDVALFTERILKARPTPRALGLAFGLGGLYFLVMIFAHVFTTVYDYIPVVGPFLRDRFWQVHLVVGLVLLAALWAVREMPLPSRDAWPRETLVLTALLSLGVAGSAWVVTARPTPAAATEKITVLTYNIQQGYSADGQRNFDGQLELIRATAADIIGLQETDNARIAGGNADVVRYLANALNMYAYYGPKTPAGTFGIALLSRYPIRQPRTWYLYSEGEQVAVIEAVVEVGDQSFHVFVTHLGNGGPLVQQRQFLRLVEGREWVIAMGDFNFRPDTPQYRLTTRALVDTWTARWPTWKDDQGLRPTEKIDHIFVSPDVLVLDARYILSPASDHPAVTATLAVSP